MPALSAPTKAAAPERLELDGRTLRLAKRDVKLDGRELGLLRESNDLLDDVSALRARMEEDGYLLLRGVLPESEVLGARRAVLEHLDAQNQVERSHALMDGFRAPSAKGAYLGGRREVTHSPGFLALAESQTLFDFYGRFFAEPAMTINYKWLRAVGAGDSTSPHYDVVYMGRGTTVRLFTSWIPLGDVGLEDGPLAVLKGSHNLPSYQRVRETYGRADVDRDNIESFFSHDPLEITARYGGQWQTTAFRAGDLLLFGMFTMHGAISNMSERFRLSTDLRFQPVSEPLDERWIGDTPLANYGWRKTPAVPLEVSRKEWNV
ncbi:MAG: phytanoyl-CoA dioxygenase family protein [Planctomycetes bacterium]|nr:phytanoyl-CoA dioxygenase family protein [Planctomycetota bacterium]